MLIYLFDVPLLEWICDTILVGAAKKSDLILLLVGVPVTFAAIYLIPSDISEIKLLLLLDDKGI